MDSKPTSSHVLLKLRIEPPQQNYQNKPTISKIFAKSLFDGGLLSLLLHERKLKRVQGRNRNSQDSTRQPVEL